MIDEKTLRWLESQGRTTNEIHNKGVGFNDTGLCNRIFHWEVAEIINKFNNFEYTIYLDESYWPELVEMIELPHTKFFPISSDDDKNRRDELIQNSHPLLDRNILDILNNKVRLKHNHFYSDFKFSIMPDLDSIKSKYNYISNIKLTDDDLDLKIKELTVDMIGIHIRRGRGIIYTDSVKSLPANIQSEYVSHRKKEGEFTEKFYMYNFIEDSIYFNIIDSILEENPNQKFYISHDLPDNLLNYYSDKYPGIVYTKSYFYNFIKGRYHKTSISHVTNIVDLFCLSYTKFLISSPESTWSTFAKRYTDKITRMATDDINLIIDTYKSIK